MNYLAGRHHTQLKSEELSAPLPFCSCLDVVPSGTTICTEWYVSPDSSADWGIEWGAGATILSANRPEQYASIREGRATTMKEQP